MALIIMLLFSCTPGLEHLMSVLFKCIFEPIDGAHIHTFVFSYTRLMSISVLSVMCLLNCQFRYLCLILAVRAKFVYTYFYVTSFSFLYSYFTMFKDYILYTYTCCKLSLKVNKYTIQYY